MLRVKIDIALLRKRVAKLECRKMSNGDVFKWLLARGFQTTRGGWLGPPAGLGVLQLREIIFSYPINDVPPG